jgi:hypothetical protein
MPLLRGKGGAVAREVLAAHGNEVERLCRAVHNRKRPVWGDGALLGYYREERTARGQGGGGIWLAAAERFPVVPGCFRLGRRRTGASLAHRAAGGRARKLLIVRGDQRIRRLRGFQSQATSADGARGGDGGSAKWEFRMRPIKAMSGVETATTDPFRGML